MNSFVGVRQPHLKEINFNDYVEYITDPRGKSHDFRYDLDHNKITNELGWKPQYTLDESVKETVKWYVENQEWVKNIKNGEYKKWVSFY